MQLLLEQVQEAQRLGAPFDLILMSDVVYEASCASTGDTIALHPCHHT